MGNPGVLPSPVHGHNPATEVDGTMGNPGVPAGGHGISSQMASGGSPSATEIDGMGRQNAPLQQVPAAHQPPLQQHGAGPNGPYEMGYERP